MVADLFVGIVVEDRDRIETIRQAMLDRLSPEDCGYVVVEVKRHLAKYRRNQAVVYRRPVVSGGKAPPRPVMPVGGLAERLLAKVGGDLEAGRAVIRKEQVRAALAALYGDDDA